MANNIWYVWIFDSTSNPESLMVGPKTILLIDFGSPL